MLAIDKNLNKEYILNRLTDEEKKLVTLQKSDFTDAYYPKVDLITSFFSLPFCEPKYFDSMWKVIFSSLNKGGYFVGQLFGDRDLWKDNKNINTFTIEKVREYLKNYEIIKLDEIEYVRKFDKKKWHFYNIIARKK